MFNPFVVTVFRNVIETKPCIIWQTITKTQLELVEFLLIFDDSKVTIDVTRATFSLRIVLSLAVGGRIINEIVRKHLITITESVTI